MLAIISTAQEVVSALAYMHEHDIIHGDVRGSNIMLCSTTANPRGFTAQVNANFARKVWNAGCCFAVLCVLCHAEVIVPQHGKRTGLQCRQVNQCLWVSGLCYVCFAMLTSC